MMLVDRLIMIVLVGLVSTTTITEAFHIIGKNPDHTNPDHDNRKQQEKYSNMVTQFEKLTSTDDYRHSKLADSVLQPFVKAMKPLLGEHSGKAKREEEKLMTNLALSMAKRGQELLKEQRDEKVNLLLGVLLEKQKDAISLEDQYEVLEDKSFRTLDVAKMIKERKGKDQRDLVEQCGEVLDEMDKKSNNDEDGDVEKSSEDIDQESEKNEENEEQKQTTASRKAIPPTKDFREEEPVQERSANAKAAAIDGLTKKIKEMARGLNNGRQEGSLSHVEQAIVAKHIKILQMALKALKKGDMELLKQAKDDLQASLEELRKKKEREMIVLMQTGTSSKGCPYCKASCFEECHKKGKTYVTCLKKCAQTSK